MSKAFIKTEDTVIQSQRLWNKKHSFIRFLKKYYLEIIFIIPILLFILGFTIWPILQTILLSFKDSHTQQWSLSTYKYLFQKQTFINSIKNTLFVSILALFIQITIGMLIALLLKMKFKGRGLVRALVLMPMGVPTLVSGVAMLYVFGTSGYLNEILFRLNIIDIPVNWTATTFSSMLVVAIADSWKVMPIVVLLLLAGLESIPTEVYEASSIDGANKWQSFIYITLPYLKSTLTMTILLRVVDLLRIFELPTVLLGRTTPFLGTFAFDEYKYSNYNASAVASTVLLVLIIVVVTLYLTIFNREEGNKI